LNFCDEILAKETDDKGCLTFEHENGQVQNSCLIVPLAQYYCILFSHSHFKFLVSYVHLLHTMVLFQENPNYIMSDRLPKIDSHVIGYFLNMADGMEKQLDDETYASVKRIFSKDVFMYEAYQKV